MKHKIIKHRAKTKNNFRSLVGVVALALVVLTYLVVNGKAGYTISLFSPARINRIGNENPVGTTKKIINADGSTSTTKVYSTYRSDTHSSTGASTGVSGINSYTSTTTTSVSSTPTGDTKETKSTVVKTKIIPDTANIQIKTTTDTPATEITLAKTVLPDQTFIKETTTNKQGHVKDVVYTVSDPRNNNQLVTYSASLPADVSSIPETQCGKSSVMCNGSSVTVGCWGATGAGWDNGKQSSQPGTKARECMKCGAEGNWETNSVDSCHNLYQQNPAQVVLPPNAGPEYTFGQLMPNCAKGNYAPGEGCNNTSIAIVCTNSECQPANFLDACWDGGLTPSGGSGKNGRCYDGNWVTEEKYNKNISMLQESCEAAGLSFNNGMCFAESQTIPPTIPSIQQPTLSPIEIQEMREKCASSGKIYDAESNSCGISTSASVAAACEERKKGNKAGALSWTSCDGETLSIRFCSAGKFDAEGDCIVSGTPAAPGAAAPESQDFHDYLNNENLVGYSIGAGNLGEVGVGVGLDENNTPTAKVKFNLGTTITSTIGRVIGNLTGIPFAGTAGQLVGKQFGGDTSNNTVGVNISGGPLGGLGVGVEADDNGKIVPVTRIDTPTRTVIGAGIGTSIGAALALPFPPAAFVTVPLGGIVGGYIANSTYNSSSRIEEVPAYTNNSARGGNQESEISKPAEKQTHEEIVVANLQDKYSLIVKDHPTAFREVTYKAFFDFIDKSSCESDWGSCIPVPGEKSQYVPVKEVERLATEYNIDLNDR